MKRQDKYICPFMMSQGEQALPWLALKTFTTGSLPSEPQCSRTNLRALVEVVLPPADANPW